MYGILAINILSIDDKCSYREKMTADFFPEEMGHYVKT